MNMNYKLLLNQLSASAQLFKYYRNVMKQIEFSQIKKENENIVNIVNIRSN